MPKGAVYGLDFMTLSSCTFSEAAGYVRVRAQRVSRLLLHHLGRGVNAFWDLLRMLWPLPHNVKFPRPTSRASCFLKRGDTDI
ncbi:hypothetical protein NDU88_008519 [Pleurodeles waltl]|uniref:Uncharacterized protein n=1 Tax=Pleurodeles waltl TaxID=8319 RepID=A0AAV7NA04_PLEWA|nr:hypothetical protein NDU88_008519 [Pleurodeles waltl]